MRHTQLNDFNVHETDLDKSIRSTVITSVNLQDNEYSYYWTQNSEQMDENPSKFKIGSNTTNFITCNCVNCDLSEYDVDDEEVRMINSSNTAKHTDLFQCNNNEINTTYSEFSDESIRSTVITSVSQQDSEYYFTHDNKEINDIRSEFTACNNCNPNEYYSDDEVQKTDNFGTTKYIDLFQCSDYEMNTTSLECSEKSIGSTVITPVNQEDNGYNHDWIKDNDEKIINTRPKLTAGNNKINVITCKYDDLSENCTNNGVNLTNCFTVNKHHSLTNSFQSSNDEKNIASSTKKSIGSTIVTSVRQQENECYVYLTEYDEGMNEIRSEVYNILKPIFTSSEEPLQSFIVTSADQYRIGYNDKYTQQPFMSFEHDSDPEVPALKTTNWYLNLQLMDFYTKIITNLTETFGKENEKNEKDKNNKLA
ncbi:hypothetical protein AGLY_017659 [Aphis glycines]|uniref:Uncharacterized protein n=1 Tax=Aphis glycines TaxID=307491 RepID=A0A6G0SUZ8_APHGL|nr:hypothetical protein AGLY_017659 [Aphis glycines]